MVEASSAAWVWPGCVKGSRVQSYAAHLLAGAHTSVSQDSGFSGSSRGSIPLRTTGLLFGCVRLSLTEGKKIVFHVASQTTC